jgi:hypothetical protein
MSNWSKQFDKPINVSNGGQLISLHDAAEYIAALPEREHRRQAWKKATGSLMSAADGRLSIMVAYIAVLRALGQSERASKPNRKN